MCGLAVVLGALDAAAQTPVLPVKVDGPEKIPTCSSSPNTLTTEFRAGNWQEAQKLGTAIVECIRAVPRLDRFDLKRDYVMLVWAGADAFDKPTLFRMIVGPDAASRVPFTLTLPGLDKDSPAKLWQVFLAPTSAHDLTSALVSTPVADPLLAQIPAVVEKLGVPFFTAIASKAGSMGFGRSAAPSDELWVTTFRLNLPEARATLTIKDVLVPPKELSEITTELGKVRQSVLLREAGGIQVVEAFAGDLHSEIAKKFAEAPCQKPGKECVASIRDEIDRLLREFLAANPTHRAQALAVDKSFRAFVDAQTPEKVTGDFTLKNTPLTRLSFGIMSGVSFGRFGGSTRVKVDGGKIVSDPLGRQISLVTLNFARPYNADLASPSARERLRGFVGGVISPDFGLGAGGSYLLMRGVGINVGVAALFVSSAADGEAIDQTLNNKTDPLKFGAQGVFFAGLSYNFK